MAINLFVYSSTDRVRDCRDGTDEIDCREYFILNTEKKNN